MEPREHPPRRRLATPPGVPAVHITTEAIAAIASETKEASDLMEQAAGVLALLRAELDTERALRQLAETQRDYYKDLLGLERSRHAESLTFGQRAHADVLALLGVLYDRQPLPGKEGEIESAIRLRYER